MQQIAIKNRFKTIYYKILLSIIILLTFFPLSASAQSEEQGIILIVASYNPDTKRMSSFISDFEKNISKYDLNYQVLIENLGCKGIDEAAIWRDMLNDMLIQYKNRNIKALIFLGQEAFSSFMQIDDFPKDIPFFGCFVSSNGITLPSATINTNTWYPESLEMKLEVSKKGICGGVFNKYDINKNIKLILDIYPDTKNIAFVSDNTYGGISLQAYVKKEIKNFPALNLILIDSRTTDPKIVAKTIADLPKQTILLLGTWRVDMNNIYLLENSITTLNSIDKTIPIFSLSGTGIDNIAIGGYIPKYSSNASIVAEQIYKFHCGDTSAVQFSLTDGEYTFNKLKLEEFAIRESHLPKGSVIIDDTEYMMKKYRFYFYFAGVIIFILIVLITWLYKTYHKNTRLKNELLIHEKELIIAKERAEESDRLKTAFLANMSHEIRTPLNAIVGFSTLLCEDPFPEEYKDEYSQIIFKNSNLLLILINDILDISRMETGKMAFNYTQEDIFNICEQVLSTTEHLRKPDIEYKFEYNCDSFLIDTDLQRISQVLINLITNANKFTDKGNITLAYEVRENQNKVIFTVTDTGCGIPKEQRNKVFNRFEKLNDYKQGTGLGLAISKQIAINFKGDIWIDPDYEGGSKFIFVHPIRNIDKIPEDHSAHQ